MISLPSHRYLTPFIVAILILLSIHVLSIANYSLNPSAVLASHTSTSQHTIPGPPPPEYPTTYPSDPDARCEANHGLPYLQHIAQNHIPYCEAKSSKSGFECFRTIYDDLICVAQGVQYNSKPPPPHSDAAGLESIATEEHKPFSMNCQMRNLTQERLDDPSEANLESLKGFRAREKMKEYMYDTGIPFQLKSWGDNDGQICNARHNDGTYTVLVKREQTGNIWHRLLEMWQVKLSLDALQMSTFLGAGFDRTKIQVVFQDDTPGPWDELLWPMLTGSKPVCQSELKDGCLGKVILPLPGSTSPFWWGVWEDLPCRESFLFNPFIKAALKHMGLDTPPRLDQDTVVTIVNRTGTSNTRQLWNIDSHASALRASFPDITVQVLDFATIELRKQIQIIRDTDVLIGAMGAGLTYLFFMNEESSIAEVLAPGAHYDGFRNLAKVRKVPYFMTHGVAEEEFVGTEEYKRVMGLNLKLEAGEPELAEEGKELAATPHDEQAYQRRSKRRTVRRAKRHWQDDPYLYLSEKQFIALAAAAIDAQGNRGTRMKDVYPH